MAHGRWPIVVLMISSLILAEGARRWADQTRRTAEQNPLLPLSTARDSGESGASGNLSDMDSYALGLLLGGLRGPLVMFLWSTSEEQKSSHNLEDFDTKVEWIRLLQPEFDTVHLFQIWNKAYNISAQMANLPSKYASILDGLDYAASVDRQRPDDINIVFNIGQVYADKLGGSHEAYYYIPRVRQETMAIRSQTLVTMPDARLAEFTAAAHAVGMDMPLAIEEPNEVLQTYTVKIEGRFAAPLRARFSGDGVVYQDLPMPKLTAEGTVRRDRLDPMLDANGYILPRLLEPIHPRPAGRPADQPWYDGSMLQFLAEYQPFPYGLSPQAIGYSYYRRAQMLQNIEGEENLQTSPMVIDSRPGLELKFWGEEEAEEGRRAELRLFGMDDSGEKISLQLAEPGADPDHPLSAAHGLPAIFLSRSDPPAGDRALRAYADAARYYRDSRAGLQQHIQLFPGELYKFQSHIDDDDGFANMYQADHDFLAGLLDPGQRDVDWATASEHYTTARQTFALIVLRYYVDDDLAAQTFPIDPANGRPRTKQNIDQLPPEQYVTLLNKVLAAAKAFYGSRSNEYQDDRDDNVTYSRHCLGRLMLLGR